MQVLEQPSPSRKLPSSHCSLPNTMPSPQLDAHAIPVGQVGSARQSGEQPSNPTVLPSSQLSAPSLILSPQVVGVHVLGAPSHLKPCSMRQCSLQPSPPTAFLSSQPSFGSGMPSPHV